MQVPVPVVHEDERLLVKHLEYQGFYRVIARYGYVDQVDQGPAFITALMQQLELEQRIIIASRIKVIPLTVNLGTVKHLEIPFLLLRAVLTASGVVMRCHESIFRHTAHLISHDVLLRMRAWPVSVPLHNETENLPFRSLPRRFIPGGHCLQSSRTVGMLPGKPDVLHEATRQV